MNKLNFVIKSISPDSLKNIHKSAINCKGNTKPLQNHIGVLKVNKQTSLDYCNLKNTNKKYMPC